MARNENYNIVSKRKQNGYEQQKIESKIIVVQIQCGWLKGAPTQNTHLWKESIMEVVVVGGGILKVTFTGSGHGVPDITLSCVAYKSRPLSTNTSSNQLFKKH